MSEMLDMLMGLIKPMWMGTPRLIAAFALFPLFSGHLMSGVVRNGLVLSVTVLLFPMLSETFPKGEFAAGLWIALIAKEILIGVVLGFLMSIPFWVVESLGHMVDFQTGMSNSSVFDPIMGQETAITSQFLVQLMGVLFFSTGGFLVFLSLFYESYAIWPVYEVKPMFGPVFERLFLSQIESMMDMMIRIAAPVIGVLLIAEFGLGLIGRFAPQLNVFALAQPIKGALATLMMILFVAYMLDSLKTYLTPGRGILKILSGTL